MSTIVENINPISVEIEPKNSVLTQTGAIVEIQEPEYAVTVQRKEYKVVSDNIYIPRLYDDAPPWMKDLIGTVVDIKTAVAVGNLDDALEALRTLSDELEVAKNTYTMSIVSSNDIDKRINTAIETLNSSLLDADATILNIAQTATTPEEASAIAINILSASLSASGEIGAFIANMNIAFADLDSATTESINLMESAIKAEFNANATAVKTIRTYVGIDEAGASTGTGLLADVEILQKQNDGVIETVTGTYDVMVNPQDPNLAELVVSAEPYASWKAQDLTGISTRLAHIGDVYIKYNTTSNGAREYVASYKFIRTIVDSTSPYATDSDGFTWALIVDQAAQDAYQQALNAYDLADNKRRVFVSTPIVPYDVGDLWLVQTGATIIGTTQGGRLIQSGDTLRCCETKTKTGLYEHNDWIPADSYREGMNAIQSDLNSWRTGTYAPFVSNIQSQVDKKSETFYQNSIPTGRIKSTNVANNSVLNAYIGDIWKNTYVGTISGYLGNNTEYVYTKIANGSNWNYDWTKMEVPDIVFDTIDTKKSIYSGNSVPVAIAPDVIEINDMWITGSSVVSGYDKESIYVWNGTAWIKPLKYTDDTATVALQTGLANGTTTIKLTNAYVGTVPFTTYIASEIDGKVGVYSGETAPIAGQPNGVAVNDIYLWFTTASKVLASGVTQVYDITRTYKYSGSAWIEITTDSNITALADLADGKRTIFSGNTIPTSAVARDIWIPSATNGTYIKGEIYQYNGTSWIIATKYSADLEAVKNNLQSQVDGKVDTYYQGTVPVGMTALNNGDYWYCTADVSTYKKGKVYKYVHATTSWIETADVSRYAFDTADGKASIFSSTSVPTAGYKINDMLIVIGSFNNGTTTFSDGVVLSSNANRVSGFTPSDWVKKINDTEDLDRFIDVTYTPTVTSLKNQIDGKIESWYTLSTNDPKTAWTDAQTRAKHDGDMWYQTDTKLSYYYSSSTNSWNLIDDAKAIQALANAATAQATADGKISSYYMNTLAAANVMSNTWTATEKTNNIGDLVVIWNDSTLDNNGTWRWNGTSWVTTRDKKLVALASDVTNLSTELNNGTNTWASADSNLENSLRTEVTDEGARVESKFAYNSNVNINGVWKKSGFGLTTNYVSGSGTQADPYVSEFWIDASRFKFTNSNQTGQVAPFTIDATGATPQVRFNGKVSFSNVTGAPGGGSNLLYNSAPMIANETKGWSVGWYNTGITPALGAGWDPWRPSGGGSVYALAPGAPTVGTVFDVAQTTKIPIIGGTWYEASAYISSHRCTSYVTIAWYDSNNTYITEVGGSQTAIVSSGALSNWSRSTLLAQAPANAARAQFYVRSIVRGADPSGIDPYCFIAFAYLGKAVPGQVVFSDWSEGTSAGVSSGEVVNDINNGNTTTINGGKITTNSITAAQIAADAITADKINVTTLSAISANLGTITSGIIYDTTWNGSTYKMKIDLTNGSIYIK